MQATNPAPVYQSDAALLSRLDHFIAESPNVGDLLNLVAWEASDTATCAICEADADGREAGVCRHCRERLPLVTSCRLTFAAFSAALTGQTSTALEHLARCVHCRDAADQLAALASAATLEWLLRSQGPSIEPDAASRAFAAD